MKCVTGLVKVLWLVFYRPDHHIISKFIANVGCISKFSIDRNFPQSLPSVTLLEFQVLRGVSVPLPRDCACH